MSDADDNARGLGPRASKEGAPGRRPRARVSARPPKKAVAEPTTVRGGGAKSPASEPNEVSARRPSARPRKSRSAKSEVAEAPAKPAARTTSSGRVRAQREESILVTGICGRLGKLLARHLHRHSRVVGVDRRPFEGKPKDIVHYQFDLRRKKIRDVFRTENVRAVVHLGVLHDPRENSKMRHSWNVVAFQKLLDCLTQFEVPKLVVLSSANVYGPQPDNPQFLTEEAPLLGAQEFRGIRDLVELDMLAQSFFWRHPRSETVILRPCHILGRVNNAPSNYLRLERPMSLLGFDPMVQVIHERDVVLAVEQALQPGIRGIFNLRGPGELPLSRVFRALGRRPLPVPLVVARAALERLWRYRLTSFPPPEIDHIRYLCMVDDSRARTVLGYAPRYSIEDTIHAVVSDR